MKNVAEEWECVEEEVGCGGEFWQYGKQCKSGTNGGHPEKGEAKHTGRKYGGGKPGRQDGLGCGGVGK